MAKRTGKLKDERADMDGLDVPRVSNADLVKPPSAVKRKQKKRVFVSPSQRALDAHEREKPTKEHAAKGEFIRVPGETIDTRHKGEMLLVNLANKARGAGTMFNRGQISGRELRAATRLCELAEAAQGSQLSGLPMGERVDGGKIDLDGSRLEAARTAQGKYLALLAELSRHQRKLVENVIVAGRPLEEAVRLQPLAEWLGADNTLRNRCNKAMVLLRDGLDHIADTLHLAEG